MPDAQISQFPAQIRKIKKGSLLTRSLTTGAVQTISCRCMKTDLFSGQAWRGYDCAATCLLLIIRLQNFRAIAALNSNFYNWIAIILGHLRMHYRAFSGQFDEG
ncbi:hypothetical protein PROVRUST_08242 [Providencia rustigianii DSM 4541]|uniref:Uncharacterized protein n=1 Tax=Providencia rustigianii DSM 4541 TaxID=500637 RepID=D1P7M1_9GAMM|nr:hypothetical protein PROVRUST_08242 [Providencia rustigianii DSM 4541]